MKQLYLNRFFMDINNTLGVLKVEGLSYPLFTNELSWRFNRPFKSCIPEGDYYIEPYTSEKFGECFKILDVPGRSCVLIHSGNIFDDTKGCILVGLKIGKLLKEEAVLDSRAALKILRYKIKNRAILQIRNRY